MQIPVQLRLADSEVSSLEQPPTLYVSKERHVARSWRRCSVVASQGCSASLLSLLLLLLYARAACSACPSCRPWFRGRATCTALCRPRLVGCRTWGRRAQTCPGLGTAACRSSCELLQLLLLLFIVLQVPWCWNHCCCRSCGSAACRPGPASTRALCAALALQQTLARATRAHHCRRNVPAGVLYDLVAAPSGELPWRLTIHFRGFPSK